MYWWARAGSASARGRSLFVAERAQRAMSERVAECAELSKCRRFCRTHCSVAAAVAAVCRRRASQFDSIAIICNILIGQCDPLTTPMAQSPLSTVILCTRIFGLLLPLSRMESIFTSCSAHTYNFPLPPWEIYYMIFYLNFCLWKDCVGFMHLR